MSTGLRQEQAEELEPKKASTEILRHAVVGSVEVLAGAFATDRVTAADFAHFLLWTTLGNALGGPFFVAFVKYGHARPEAQIPYGRAP
jgi:hypothetical protein